MLKKKELLELIAMRLATLKAYVSTVNSIHLFDVNVVAEDFFAALLNEIYGYSLVNLNHTDLNKAAIDLGDVGKRVAVQVTSERTKTKIQKTVNKFVDHGLEDEYDTLKIVIIGDRTGAYATLDVPSGIPFSGKNDVVDIAGLMSDINRLDVPALERIADVIRRDLAEQTTTPDNAAEFREISEAHSELLKQQTHQTEQISGVADAVDGLQTVVTSQVHGLRPLAIAHEATLELAKDLLTQNKPSQALSLLEKQRTTIWATANPETKARLLCSIGGAKHGLGDDAGAAKLFFEARQHDPDDEKVLCNVAVAYLLTGDRENAEATAQQVLERNPTNSRAFSVLIQSTSKPIAAIIEDLPVHFQDDAGIAMAVGFVARNQGDTETAKIWLRKALENDEDTTPEIIGMLGETLITEITGNPKSAARIGQLTEEDRRRIEEGLSLLLKACETFGNDSALRSRITWLLNAAIANRLLDRGDDAAQLVERARRVDPEHPAVLYQSAVSAHGSGDFDAAVDYAKLIETSDEIPHAKLFLANLLGQAGRNDEAITELTAFLSTSPKRELANSARQTLVEVCVEVGDLPKASEVIEEAIASDPSNVNSLVVAAQLYRRRDNTEDAEAALDKAYRVVVDDTPTHHLEILGNELGVSERWAEAATIFAKLASDSEDSPVTRKYIDACFRSSRLDEAFTVCRKLRELHGPLEFVTDVEVGILEQTGDLPEARSVCEAYLKAFPDNARKRIWLAVVYLRQRDYQALDSFLEDLPDWRLLPVECGQQIASLLLSRKRYAEAIELLYEMRRVHSTGQVHFQYVQTCLAQGDEKQEPRTALGQKRYDGEQVATDVAVAVKDSSGTIDWFIIEDREDPEVGSGELNTEHKLAIELLGKKVGDTFTLKESMMGSEQGIIEEITSKYVHAFHESGRMLEVRFPDDAQGFCSFKMTEGEEGVHELLRKLESQQEDRKEAYRTIYDLYLKNPMPVGAIARCLGMNILEVWSYLTANPDHKLICSTGSPAEQKEAERLLRTQNAQFVIDPVSLLTIHALGIANSVVESVGRLGIVQATIDLLIEALHKRTVIHRTGFSNFKKAGEQLVGHEVGRQEAASDLLSIECLIKWIEENCDVLPWSPALATIREESDQLAEIAGEESMQTVLVAIEPNRFLFSDDLRLRQLANAEFEIEGLSTQSLLMHMVATDVIDAERYNRTVIRIANAGFVHTSVSAEVLLEAARQAGWSPDAPYEKVAALLGGEYCGEASAVGVAANFLHLLWQKAYLSRSTDYVTLRLLDELARQRHPLRVTDKLLDALSIRFALNPVAELELQKIIQAWRAIRVV